jgi:hypothetical protein
MTESEQNTTETPIHMGNYLRKILLERGYSPGGFADFYDFSRNVITTAVKKERINPKLIYRIGKCLDLDLYSIFYPSGNEAEVSEVNAPLAIYKSSSKPIQESQPAKVLVELDLSNPDHLQFLMGFLPNQNFASV